MNPDFRLPIYWHWFDRNLREDFENVFEMAQDGSPCWFGALHCMAAVNALERLAFESL